MIGRGIGGVTKRKIMKVIALNPNAEGMITQIAQLLVIGFKYSWPDMASALEEVQDCLEPSRINRLAVAEGDIVVGWIGGRSMYEGHVWDLHPLVVHPDYQRQGIGRLLVRDFETQVQARGGITIYLGTDDEDDQTSLAGTDVYPHVLSHLAQIKNLHGHPYEFYQKMGYVLVGMVPDANGLGKPDILMARRVGEWELVKG